MNNEQLKRSLRYRLRDIWRKAEEFRARYWPGNEVPVDIDLIVEKQFTLIPESIKQSGFVACLAPDMKSIYVDTETMLDESQAFFFRFSLAHEVGHAVLHGGLFKYISGKDYRTVADWAKLIRQNHDAIHHDYFDQDAHEFAGRLLVPRDRLEVAVQSIMDKLTRKERREIESISSDRIRRAVARKIHRNFEVNIEVVEIRLRKEGLIGNTIADHGTQDG